VHDYFDILGVPPGACARDIRRARRRRAVLSHPDVQDGDTRTATSASASIAADPVAGTDVAIDFVDMASIVDRMQAAFFART
jgi:DnaJ-like protein